MIKILLAGLLAGPMLLPACGLIADEPSVVLRLPGAKSGDLPGQGKKIVLISGDEEYRSEEGLPMLGKILSQRHGFDCVVLFAWDPSGKFIDPNNQRGLRGWEELSDADLMIIATRFRQPQPEEAAHVTEFLNRGKPVIGLRTATHAFRGGGKFGEQIGFGEFGIKVLGERWVSHHGGHKSQGCRGVIEKAHASHPVLNSVRDVFAPSDVYGVTHLTDADQILLRGAVTASLDPASKPIAGPKNDPPMPLAWLHRYVAPNGKPGRSFCTTAGASVDLLSEDLRRLIVNAAYYLTDMEPPASANVELVDPFRPAFFGFIKDESYWPAQDLQPRDFGLGKSPMLPDPPGTPKWPFRDR